MTDETTATAPAAATEPAAPSGTPRRVEYKRLDTLRDNPKNPKSHDLATIDKSYERFGVVDNITEDGRTGYIISGHGRKMTLSDAFSRGETPPEGVMVDEDGMWLVPVNTGWSSRNDAHASAALIAMNRLTELGGWEDESLLRLLEELEESGDGFDGVGFSAVDMDDLKHLLEDVPDLDELADEFDPDNVPGSGDGGAAVIKLTDPALIDTWHAARDLVKTDDEAFRDLTSFFDDTKPRAPESTAPASRVDAPTAADLPDEPADEPVEDAPEEGAELPDDPRWATAGMDDESLEEDGDDVLSLSLDDEPVDPAEVPEIPER